MALNASIFGNMLNAPKSPESYAAERQQLQAGELTNALSRQKADAYTRDQERQTNLLGLLKGGADAPMLRRNAFLKEADEMEKGAAEVGLKRSQGLKYEADAADQKFKTAMAQLEAIHNAAAGATDQQSYSLSLDGLRSAGVDISSIPPQFDPAYVANAKNQALTQMQRLEDMRKQQEFGLKKDQFGETQKHNRASEGIQIRGQNMTDSRARDFNAVQVEANNIKRGEKKEVADLTKNSQVASFDTMLGTLDRLGKHPGLSRSVGMTGAFPTMPGSDSANFQAELNTFQSQAFLPMVAQLKGMGALSDAEGKKLTAAVGALDPKMGEKAFRDSVARITADMEQARTRVAGQPRAGGASGAWDSSAGPQAGAVDGGYRFKGGNPADKSNWEKVQ